MIEPEGPETLNEAKSFDSIVNHAMAYGLCVHCASRLAWGHQNGFKELPAPCPIDRILLRLLPVEKPNGWRTVAGRAASVTSWPSRG